MDMLEKYVERMSEPETELLQALDHETHMQTVHPRMLSGHIQGKFLEMLVRMLRPRRILEIGTFTGYSALSMAAGLDDDATLDTIESEEGAVHIDLRARIVNKRDLFYLKQFPNVIFTSHYAFFTEEATSAMVQCALKSLSCFEKGEKNPYEIG